MPNIYDDSRSEASYDGTRGSAYAEDADVSDARIGSQLGFMSDQLQKLMALISDHELRIDQILMPEHERPMNAVASPPRKPASELSNTIDDLNEQIGRAQARIQGLTGRVQL